MKSIPLSVLDQSPIRSGADAAAALHETIALAQLCEGLGYRRFWISEHHASEGLAGVAPEVLLARLGVETRSIRLGSGGVMLPGPVIHPAERRGGGCLGAAQGRRRVAYREYASDA